MISVPTHYKSTFTLGSLFLLILLLSPTTIASEPLLDINTAHAEELAQKLSGIGPAKKSEHSYWSMVMLVSCIHTMPSQRLHLAVPALS